MKICRGRLYQLALLVTIGAVVTSCSLLWGGPESNATTDGNLGLTVWVSRGRTKVGQPVGIKFIVDNFGDQTEVIQLEEKQEPVMDISMLFGPGGDITTLYWSDGREITPEMRRLELAPGESKTLEMTWVPDEPYGSVWVSGILNRESRSQRARVMICVGECPVY